MSITTLFAKYTEASEAWRAQQLKNRQNEIILEQVPAACLQLHSSFAAHHEEGQISAVAPARPITADVTQLDVCS